MNEARWEDRETLVIHLRVNREVVDDPGMRDLLAEDAAAAARRAWDERYGNTGAGGNR